MNATVFDSFAPRPSRLAGYSNQLNYRTLELPDNKFRYRAANIDLFHLSAKTRIHSNLDLSASFL
jgi:hypothetical protein